MSESAILTAICEYLAYRNHFFYRHSQIPVPIFHEGGQRGFRRFPKYSLKGVPDIVLVKEGKYIGLEVKVPKGKQSPDQKIFESALKEAGGQYAIVHSIDEVQALGL